MDLSTALNSNPVKTIGAVALCIYFINMLKDLIYFLIKKKFVQGEIDTKVDENIKDSIKETHNMVRVFDKEVKPHFWEMDRKVDDIHEVIAQKEGGVPLVYNKSLERNINQLNNNIVNLTNAIERRLKP